MTIHKITVLHPIGTHQHPIPGNPPITYAKLELTNDEGVTVEHYVFKTFQPQLLSEIAYAIHELTDDDFPASIDLCWEGEIHVLTG